jgi:hypothetical protein
VLDDWFSSLFCIADRTGGFALRHWRSHRRNQFRLEGRLAAIFAAVVSCRKDEENDTSIYPREIVRSYACLGRSAQTAATVMAKRKKTRPG